MDKSSIRAKLLGADSMPKAVLEHIFDEKYLQIWVPKIYGGLGLNLADGLKLLRSLSTTDGSFGWMITLCAGANYFSRNLKPELALELFKNKNTCFGGSGFVGGTAEKIDHHFLIQGNWPYATGAPHLSHFTLNSVLVENGKPILDLSGNQQIYSFIIPRNNVKIIAEWNAMGMKATGTFSFQIENALVDEKYKFLYNEFYTDSLIDKIPFIIFTDLTLLVNYIGIADHFFEESQKIKPRLNLKKFRQFLSENEVIIYQLAEEVEQILKENKVIDLTKENEIHHFGENLVHQISHQILDIYIQLGIQASQMHQPIHQVFCDFFTATQHVHFRRHR